MVAMGPSGVWLELAGVGGGESALVFGLAQQFPQHSPLLPEGLGGRPLLAGEATLPASFSSVGLAHRCPPPPPEPGCARTRLPEAQLVEICFPGLSRRRGGGGMRALAHGKGGAWGPGP